MNAKEICIRNSLILINLSPRANDNVKAKNMEITEEEKDQIQFRVKVFRKNKRGGCNSINIVELKGRIIRIYGIGLKNKGSKYVVPYEHEDYAREMWDDLFPPSVLN